MQDVFGCRADRKQLSATATLILSPTEKRDDPGTVGEEEPGAGERRAPLLDSVCSNVGWEMGIVRCVGGTCGAGGVGVGVGGAQSSYRRDNSSTLKEQQAGWSWTQHKFL